MRDAFSIFDLTTVCATYEASGEADNRSDHVM